ncbi:hypothetical protein L3Q82_025970, partial [Scortum barcoo]
MSLPESQDNSEDDALYNFIFEWKAWDDEEKREIVQIPFRCRHTPTKTDTKQSHANDAVNLVKCYTVGNAERIDMDALENIQGIPELTMNKDEKPQTTAGANITDYFNYGFDEESWSVDFSKQLTLSAANRKLAAKNMVATEMSPEEERITSYLPGPSRGNCLFAYTLPPSVSPSTSRSVPFSGRVIANAWERYRQQEKCDNDRDGLRDHGHNKLRGRDRAKDRDSCSSSHDRLGRSKRGTGTLQSEGTNATTALEDPQEKGERQRQRELRDNSKGWQKASY